MKLFAPFPKERQVREMNGFRFSRRSFFQVAGSSSLGIIARMPNGLAANPDKMRTSPEFEEEPQGAVSVALKDVSPLGVFLASHRADTGMQFWTLERWRKEIQTLRSIGARSVWYLPMQFGQREELDFDDTAPHWTLQKGICRAIAEAGLTVGIYVGLNDIFAGTANANPGWKAQEGRYFLEEGQVCPSHPSALQVIMRLRERLFAQLPQVDYVITPITDYGGCSCDKCSPYPLTYLRVLEQEAATCRRFHPHAKIVAAGHIVGLDDEDMLRAQLRKTDWVDYVADIPRGAKPIIKYYMNPEITMVNGWGIYGPCPALPIIRQTYLQDYPHMAGAMPYSEGIHDDVNRFAVLRYASNPNLTVSGVARQYAEEMLELTGSSATRVAEAIAGLGNQAGSDRALFYTEYGPINPDADDRLKALIDARTLNPKLKDNYRYWLLQYRAACESFSVPTGPLNIDILIAEAEIARQAFLRLEPEYGRFLVGHHPSLLPGRSLWTWQRTFRGAWKRENTFFAEK